MTPRAALTIGNFDGVHLGHAALVARAREAVGARGRVVVMTFDPHPRSVLTPGAAPPRLTTFDQRAELLRALGADVVERLEPTRELLGKSARAFIEMCVERHGVGLFVEGEDFCFGKGREGDVGTLRALGAEMGFDVDIVPPIEVALENQCVATCSSSLARWLLGKGRAEDASRVLGRAYEVRGVVAKGDQRGRTIGFPTANVETDQLAPMDGVYAGGATIAGEEIPAAIHVGPRGTFDNPVRTIEAHLIDWTPTGGAELYEAPIALRFDRWVRGNVRFESVHHLIDQLGRDVSRARAMTTAPTGAREHA